MQMLEASNTITTTSTDNQSLDVNHFFEDEVFLEVVKTMTPYKIHIENEALIKTFVDALAYFSPISLNSLNFYSKRKSFSDNPTNIETVQDTNAYIFLNNFWRAWNDSIKSHTLRYNLNTLLEKYVLLNQGDNNFIDLSVEFFNDGQELTTVERYAVSRDWKTKKGTKIGYEYGYKAIWMAGAEGPLRDDYYFNLQSNDCPPNVSNGIEITNDPANPCI
jgi:hypothetical protein